jgi:hypothetical protein
MSFLKKKITKPMTVVITIIVCIGTAAGAFLWISNLIQRDITITDIPLTFAEYSISPTYIDEEILWRLDYTVNEADLSTGYLWIDVWSGSAFSTSDMDITDVYILTNSGTEFNGQLVSGYPNQLAGNDILFVFEDVYGGPIDFADSAATGGQLQVALIFHVAQSFQLSLRVTSAL